MNTRRISKNAIPVVMLDTMMSIVWRFAAPFCIMSHLQHTSACISPQA